MKLLLDTHTLLWFLSGDRRLSKKVRILIEDLSNERLVSVASIWEITIKVSLNRLKFPTTDTQAIQSILTDNRIQLLPIALQHVLAVTHLDFHHRDPFDRILVTQCQLETATLLTKDPAFKNYDIKTVW